MEFVFFIAFVLAMLTLDLLYFQRKEEAPTIKESSAWVTFWVVLAVAFGLVVLAWKGTESSLEYFAGYLTEYSLSVDNMFVFLLIFGYFRVPAAYQHRVLFFGILGAIVFRGIFIAIGVTLISRFEVVLLVFGLLLLFTAYRVGKGHADYDPAHNPVLKIFHRHFRTTDKYDRQKFFTVVNGKRMATPMLVVLLTLETTDIVFAVDSIPAIFAITRDPFIVLSSNVFAVLGLRALYFLLAGSMARFHLLRYGLAIILGFVGIKMLLTVAPCQAPLHIAGIVECAEGSIEIATWFSLAVIVAVLAVTVVVSILVPPRQPTQTHAE